MQKIIFVIGWLDYSTPYTKSRWISASLLVALLLLRVLTTHGWYIVTYALGIYHLNLFIAFLTPKMDPSLNFDDEVTTFMYVHKLSHQLLDLLFIYTYNIMLLRCILKGSDKNI